MITRRPSSGFIKVVEDGPYCNPDPFDMGLMHNQGLDVPVDCFQAEEWFVKAADLGNVNAQRILGVMYRASRRGAPQDFAQAMKWFHIAADRNDGGTQFALGSMYDNGEGIVRNSSKAMEWYRKAANQGYTEACFHTGELYYDGWGGLLRDLTEAREWFQEAATRGHFEDMLINVPYIKQSHWLLVPVHRNFSCARVMFFER